jgi:hypothetical protein
VLALPTHAGPHVRGLSGGVHCHPSAMTSAHHPGVVPTEFPSRVSLGAVSQTVQAARILTGQLGNGSQAGLSLFPKTHRCQLPPLGMNIPRDPVSFEDLADSLPAQSITLADHFKDYPPSAGGNDPLIASGVRTFKGVHYCRHYVGPPTSPA